VSFGRAEGLRLAQVDPQGISPVAKIPLKVLVLLQAGLRRVLELTEAFIVETNSGLFTPPFVTARAAFETSCLLYSVVTDAEQVVLGHGFLALEEFDKKMMRALLGGKSREWTHPEEFEALNVLTIIDRLGKKMPNLKSMYELLCEYAHPNYDGMIGVYQRVTGQSATFIDHPAFREREILSTAVGITGLSLGLTERALTRYQAVLPDFVRMCEEGIHKRGTWPADMPYPRQPQRG